MSACVAPSRAVYKSVRSEWLCLKMTRATLAGAGITLKFEDPSPVGTTPALTPTLSGGLRFPHMFGGIPARGVVVEERVVYRGPGGEYLGIEGLCGATEGEVAALWQADKVKKVALLVGAVGAALALRLLRRA